MYTFIHICGDIVPFIAGVIGIILWVVPLLIDDAEAKSVASKLLLIDCFIIIFGLYCLWAVVHQKNIDYTTIVAREKIDFVKDDSDNGNIVWGVGKVKKAEKAKECEIVLINTEMYGDNVPDGLSEEDLPYYEWRRELSYSTVKFFGRDYCSKPKIDDLFIFYVSEAHLDNSLDPAVDWTSLFEVER